MMKVGDNYISTVLGATTDAAMKPVAVGAALVTKDAVVDVKRRLIPALVGGVAGYYLAKKHKLPLLSGHPVLGAIVGFTVGDLAHPLATDASERPSALAAIATVGAAAYVSTKWRKHPVLGYLGTSVIGTAVATKFIK